MQRASREISFSLPALSLGVRIGSETELVSESGVFNQSQFRVRFIIRFKGFGIGVRGLDIKYARL